MARRRRPSSHLKIDWRGDRMHAGDNSIGGHAAQLLRALISGSKVYLLDGLLIFDNWARNPPENLENSFETTLSHAKERLNIDFDHESERDSDRGRYWCLTSPIPSNILSAESRLKELLAAASHNGMSSVWTDRKGSVFKTYRFINPRFLVEVLALVGPVPATITPHVNDVHEMQGIVERFASRIAGAVYALICLARSRPTVVPRDEAASFVHDWLLMLGKAAEALRALTVPTAADSEDGVELGKFVELANKYRRCSRELADAKERQRELDDEPPRGHDAYDANLHQLDSSELADLHLRERELEEIFGRLTASPFLQNLFTVRRRAILEPLGPADDVQRQIFAALAEEISNHPWRLVVTRDLVARLRRRISARVLANAAGRTFADISQESAELMRLVRACAHLLDEVIDQDSGDNAANTILGQMLSDHVEKIEETPWPKSADLFEPVLRTHARFGGRAEELRRIDDFVFRRTDSYLFVTGPSGFGKTALLANWFRTRNSSLKIVAHFISPLVSSGTDEDFFLRNVIEQLLAIQGIRSSIPSDKWRLRSLLKQLLVTVGPQDRGIVILMDGLDEGLPRWQPDRQYFPPMLPKGVQVVFSARTMATKDWPSELGVTINTDQIITLGHLAAVDIEDIIVRGGACGNDPPRIRAAAKRLLELSDGDPFYVHELVADLEARAGDLGALRHHPVGAIPYLRKWWLDACEACGEEAFYELMGTLAIARGPLTHDIYTSMRSGAALHGGNFDIVVRRASRYLVGDDHGYSLSHRRIHEFIADRMRDRIDSFRNRICEFCTRWTEPYLSKASQDYIFRHAVDHLIDAGRQLAVPDLIRPRWLKAKVAHMGFASAVRSDVEAAVACGRGLPTVESRFLNLFRLGTWREMIAGTERPDLLGAELVQRVRLGEVERGITDATRVGNDDDRIIVFAECAALAKDKTAQGEYLRQLNAYASTGSPEALEWAAVRLATVTPMEAIALAQQITEREFVLTHDGEERATRGRCVARIFERLAEHDCIAAHRALEQVTDDHDYFFAGVAITASTILKAPEDAKWALESAFGRYHKSSFEGALHVIVARFLYWIVASAPVDRLLRGLEIVDQVHPMTSELSAFLDERISREPLVWHRSLAAMPAGRTRSCLEGRIIAQNILRGSTSPPPGPQSAAGGSFKAQVSDLVQRFADTAESKTLPSLIQAAAAMAERLNADQAASERIVRAALRWIPNDPSLRTVELLALLIPPSMRCDISVLGKVVRRAVADIMQLEPEYLRLDAQQNLGRALLNPVGIIHHDPTVLSKLLRELPSERDRGVTLRSLVDAAREEDYGHLEQAIIESVSVMRNAVADNTVLLPEMSATILAGLAERICERDAVHARDIMTKAEREFDQIPPIPNRNRVAQLIVQSYLKINPPTAWDFFVRTNCPHHVFLQALEEVLRGTDIEVAILRERWYRLTAEMFVYRTAFQRGERSADGLADRRHVLLPQLMSRPCLGIQGTRTLPLVRMFGDLPSICEQYVGHYAGVAVARYDAYEFGVATARRSWDSFRDLVRNPKLTTAILDGLHLREPALNLTILDVKEQPTMLLDDIVFLRAEWDRRRNVALDDKGEVSKYLGVLAAVHDPEVFLHILTWLPAEQRKQCLSLLEWYDPIATWSTKQLEKIFEVMATASTDDEIESLSILLAWVSKCTRIPPAMWQRLADLVRRDCKARDVALIAGRISEAEPEIAASLYLFALNRSLQEPDASTFFGVLSRVEERPPALVGDAESVNDRIQLTCEALLDQPEATPIRESRSIGRALSLLSSGQPRDSDSGRVLRDFVAVVKVRALEDIHDAARELRAMTYFTPDQVEECILALAKRYALRCPQAFEQLLECLKRCPERVALRLWRAEQATNDERDTLVSSAIQDASACVDATERWKAFQMLGDDLLTRNPAKAFEMYEAQLSAIALDQEEQHFAYWSDHFRKVCFANPGPFARQLANHYWRKVKDYRFGTAPFGAQAETATSAKISAALAAWVTDVPDRDAILCDAVANYFKYFPGDRGGVIAPSIICETIAELRDLRGPAFANQLFSELLGACEQSRRIHLADVLVRSLLYPRNLGYLPLAAHGIWQHAGDIADCDTIMAVRPFCSRSMFARCSLYVAISLSERNPVGSRAALAEAVAAAPEVGEDDDIHFAEHLPASVAALGDARECYDAIEATVLSGRSPSALWAWGSMLVGALRFASNKGHFLRTLWDSVRSVDLTDECRT